jgi:hypothetical protein
MPPLTRSKYLRQQAVIAAVPAVAYIIPQLHPAFDVDPMFKPRVKKRKQFADREARDKGWGQDWDDYDMESDVSDFEDGGLGESSAAVKKGTKSVRPSKWCCC